MRTYSGSCWHVPGRVVIAGELPAVESPKPPAAHMSGCQQNSSFRRRQLGEENEYVGDLLRKRLLYTCWCWSYCCGRPTTRAGEAPPKRRRQYLDEEGSQQQATSWSSLLLSLLVREMRHYTQGGRAKVCCRRPRSRTALPKEATAEDPARAAGRSRKEKKDRSFISLLIIVAAAKYNVVMECGGGWC